MDNSSVIRQQSKESTRLGDRPEHTEDPGAQERLGGSIRSMRQDCVSLVSMAEVTVRKYTYVFTY